MTAVVSAQDVQSFLRSCDTVNHAVITHAIRRLLGHGTLIQTCRHALASANSCVCEMSDTQTCSELNHVILTDIRVFLLELSPLFCGGFCSCLDFVSIFLLVATSVTIQQ